MRSLCALLSIAFVACGDDTHTTPDAAVDPMCVPTDDHNACTEDLCIDGAPFHNAKPEGEPCPNGACDAHGNCTAPPSCGDGTRNGSETAIDCGGACSATGHTCADDKACVVGADCTSGVCTVMKCEAGRCGDGVAQSGEMCDDGNATNGDDCDVDCRPPGCGNGIVEGLESCDDANPTNGDGCDNNCKLTACGNGVMTGAEGCDDGNAIANDGCSATCGVELGYACRGTTPSMCVSTCGDGVVDLGETCDDHDRDSNDGCSSTCNVEAGYACSGSPSICTGVCGDGMIGPGEQCDDGNLSALDGCSAGCRSDRSEVEPNDDGTPDVSGDSFVGNDFSKSTVDARGAIDISSDVAILGAIGVAGDEDGFALVNSSPNAQLLAIDTWSREAGFGVGVGCTDASDTVIAIRDATGTVLQYSDDRNGASDRCSHIDVMLAPSQTVYLQVIRYGDDATIPGYGIVIHSTAIVCGDGMTASIEECDDGDAIDTNACNNACRVTAATDEHEPNDTTATATAIATTSIVRGSRSDTDVDVYRVSIATPTVLRASTYDGVFGHCGGGQLVALLDATGALVTNAEPTACPSLVIPVAVGTYYLQITGSAIAKYFLDVATIASVGAETEPNDTSATASTNFTTAGWASGDHAVATDIDSYRLSIPPGMAVHAEIVEGDRAIETCESNDIDSLLVLLDADGTTELLRDDDAGRGWCSKLDGPTNASGATKVGYLEVRQSTLASGTGGQFIYKLVVRISP